MTDTPPAPIWLTYTAFPMDLGSEVTTRACSYQEDQITLDGIDRYGFAFPETMAKAVQKRKAEYFAGRFLAAQALTSHGFENHYPGQDDRSPVWPSGFVGSISHTTGYAAAAVAPATKYRGLGIDVEQIMTPDLARRVESRIVYSEDWSGVASINGLSRNEIITLIFSAKEAVYKCLHPLCRVFFGFEDAVFCHNGSSRSLDFELRKDLNQEFVTGYKGQIYYQFLRDKVYTACLIESN